MTSSITLACRIPADATGTTVTVEAGLGKDLVVSAVSAAVITVASAPVFPGYAAQTLQHWAPSSSLSLMDANGNLAITF